MGNGGVQTRTGFLTITSPRSSLVMPTRHIQVRLLTRLTEFCILKNRECFVPNILTRRTERWLSSRARSSPRLFAPTHPIQLILSAKSHNYVGAIVTGD